MKDNFWGRIWSSFREVQNFWYGFLGVVLAILFSVVSGKTAVPLYLLVILTTIFILITSTLFNAYANLFITYQKNQEDYQRLRHPTILGVSTDKKTASIICRIEASELFAINSLVSFYYIDDNEFESLIAVGYVKNIQRNKQAQVEIDIPDDTYQDILERLKNNDNQVIKRIFIRPTIPRNF
ncbi:hypothetical protein [Synechocystis sp. CACIAM 05]|jgi:hypothetical protein|uniref:hypothetical protein n=1 Tax=Synechocystis sp. CACIAM 05 TaxID=1933929 RepID=UPI00138E8407|nr:hypothetical protein [Synechocystis sp. CACIAM 05]QHU99095.1 hypothetical protein BWK47_02450 [Synechocystis sp. CACIAM 05]